MQSQDTPSTFKIVSGGQTGVDRAALDAAIELGIEHGGWCPHGRRSEDGTIPSRYRLDEMPGSEYADRTRQNVVDSDATLILAPSGTLQGGTMLTAAHAAQMGRPLILLDAEEDKFAAAEKIRRFVHAHRVRVLNVAGPRESEVPGLGRKVQEILLRAFAPLLGRQQAS